MGWLLLAQALLAVATGVADAVAKDVTIPAQDRKRAAEAATILASPAKALGPLAGPLAKVIDSTVGPSSRKPTGRDTTVN